MSFANDSGNPYQSFGVIAADAAVDERVDFIRKTYLHLGGAIAAFAAIETVLINSPLAPAMTLAIFSTGYGWFIMLGGFMLVSWIANSWANSSTSVGMQYAGLSLYVVAEAIIFVPLLYMAHLYGTEVGANVIGTSALITAVLFGGLTAIVFTTKADFSFLRTALMLAGVAAMGFVLCSMLFGFNLGTIFTVAMIVFACGYILYYTSNVLHHYRIGQHVAASLALFASVALLLYYVVMLVMGSRD
jgi:FtsH-binding integral membrane protein